MCHSPRTELPTQRHKQLLGKFARRGARPHASNTQFWSRETAFTIREGDKGRNTHRQTDRQTDRCRCVLTWRRSWNYKCCIISTEQATTAVTHHTYIRDILGSNPDRDMGYLGFPQSFHEFCDTTSIMPLPLPSKSFTVLTTVPGLQRHVVRRKPDVSEVHVASIKECSSSDCLLLLLVSYSSTLKMDAICSSETSGSVRTTRRYKPEDRTLHASIRRYKAWDMMAPEHEQEKCYSGEFRDSVMCYLLVSPAKLLFVS
jgi:hypothetical protein